MLRKIATNFVTTGLAAAAGFLSTLGIIINLSPEDYGTFALTLLLANSTGLLNIFRPSTLALVRSNQFAGSKSAETAAAAMAIATTIFLVIFAALTFSLPYCTVMAVSLACSLSFTSTVLTDEIEGLGHSVYPATARNLMWFIFFPTAFAISSATSSSLSLMIWTLTILLIFLNFALLYKTIYFRKISISHAIHLDFIECLKRNSKMGITNLSALTLGTSDRLFLWSSIPGSSTFGIYSAISDISTRSHTFFRVASSVVTAEISSGRHTFHSTWKVARCGVYICFSTVSLTIFFVPEILSALKIEGSQHFLVASMFLTAIPLVACGYYATAVLYSKGEASSVYAIYTPTAIAFIFLTLIVSIYSNHQTMSVVYSISRLSDIALIRKSGVSVIECLIIATITAILWVQGFALYA
ncbi:hypothetical protein [Thauera mechernichensis]